MFTRRRDKQVKVELKSPDDRPLRMRLLSTMSGEVLSGYGKLEGMASPGLYVLELASGDQVERRNLRLTDALVDDVAMSVRAAAPLPGSVGFDAAHLEAVEQIAATNAPPDGKGTLVVMVRHAGHPDAVDPQEVASGLGVVNRAFVEVAPEERIVGTGFVLLRWALTPGGYALRVRGERPTDQSIWVVEKMAQFVFIPTVHDGLALDLASIHFQDQWFQLPFDLPFRLYAEEALAALRTGTDLPPDVVMEQLYLNKMIDPMLAILSGALTLRALPQTPKSEWKDRLDRLDFMLRRTAPMIGEHPDWLSLCAIARLWMHQAKMEPSDEWTFPDVTVRLPWPPMLAVVMDGALEAFRQGELEIPELSVTDRALDNATRVTPWTRWYALDSWTGLKWSSLQDALFTAELLLSGTSATGNRGSAPNRVTERILEYLSLVERFGGDDVSRKLTALDPETIARALGVTKHGVERAFHLLRPLLANPRFPERRMHDFDLDDIRWLFEANDAPDDAIDAFLDWADAHPQEYQALVAQFQAEQPEATPKAAPEVWDPADHVEMVKEQRSYRELTNAEVMEPHTLQGVANQLVAARDEGVRVRPVGAFRSLSDVAEPEREQKARIIATSHLTDVKIHKPSKQVWVEAGCNVGRLNVELDKVGLALPNMGTGDFQTVVGAISTGTHGAGWAIGDLASTVVAVEIVTLDASGEPVLYRATKPGVDVQAYRTPVDNGVIRVVDRPEADVFWASIVSMGCLGVITSMTLAVQDRFFLNENRTQHAWSEVSGSFAADAQEVRHYEILLNPLHASADISEPALVTRRHDRNATGQPWSGANGNSRSFGMEAAALPIGVKVAQRRLARWLENPKDIPKGAQQGISCSKVKNFRRKSYRVLKIGLKVHGTGLEMAVPVVDVEAAGNKICEIIGDRYKKLIASADLEAGWRSFGVPLGPISLRVVAASPGLLSMQQPADGDPWVMIEIPSLIDPARRSAGDADPLYAAYHEGLHACYAEIEQTLRVLYGARPHWGQWFASTAQDLEPLYGDAWQRFRTVYDEFNASGLFRSAFTARMGW